MDIIIYPHAFYCSPNILVILKKIKLHVFVLFHKHLYTATCKVCIFFLSISMLSATLLCFQVLIQHLHAVEPRTTHSVTHKMFTGAHMNTHASREKERALCLHLKITLNIRYYITSFSITVNLKGTLSVAAGDLFFGGGAIIDIYRL